VADPFGNKGKDVMVPGMYRKATRRPVAHMPASVFLVCAMMLALAPAHAAEDADGNAERGRTAITRHGCVACHAIPGIRDLGSNVGPPLDRIATRGYIAGVLANTPQNMVRWLRDPPGVDPRTAMPSLGLSEKEARDIAAYLYTLK
jgi:cytochrome c